MKKYRIFSAIVFLVLVYTYASESDYQDQVRENELWCLNIANGIWFAGQAEIESRCN